MLAGAGCSTESGIPDYRGPDGRLRNRRPMQYGEFVRSAPARTRYWARSAVGWARVARARPNEGHRALARLEDRGIVRGIITQNVDGLHQAAGSRRVIELHGSLAWVRCLDCGERVTRGEHQARLLAVNPGWMRSVEGGGRDGPVLAPDGDADIGWDETDGFVVPGCLACDGVMKPDVVFFGENVPRETVDRAWELFDESDVLLVVGSSLTVYSGRRFVYRAVERDLPIAVLNLGPTRADEVAAVKLEARVGESLPRLARELVAGS